MTFIEAGLFNLTDRTERTESHKTLIDYLQKYHKNGFETSCDISINGHEPLKVEDYDIALNEDDLIVLLFRPAAPAVPYLINIAIAIAVSYLVNEIFGPEIPEAQQSLSKRNAKGKSSSVYSLNSQQNEVKIGEAIPIIYGSVRTYPALICPPYYRYENNEEYLYQLMCIGQGRYDIEKMLISDTESKTIESDFFQYKVLNYDDFATQDGIKTAVGDTNYNEIVKAIPEVENLEVKGTPANKNMAMSFDGGGNTITFYPDLNGQMPDLSSIDAGTKITISGTVSNNGIFTATGPEVGGVVTVTELVTTEPTDTISIGNEDAPNTNIAYSFGAFENSAINSIARHNWDWDGGYWLPEYWNTTKTIEVGSYVRLIGTETPYATLLQVIEKKYDSYLFDQNITTDFIETTQTVTIEYIAKIYQAEFSTSYGYYQVRAQDEEVRAIEFDYLFPNGIYSTNATTGAYEPYTVEFEMNIVNADGSPLVLPATTFSHTAQSPEPIRKSVKWFLGDFSLLNPQYIYIKRITPEQTSNGSDKLYFKSVKKIYEPKANSDYGDITLLWCKVRASNAISTIGQFQINAWVRRIDVSTFLHEIINDIYTNTSYGARLPAIDLQISTGEYGAWQLDEMYYYAELTVTGFYYITYWHIIEQGAVGMVYYSQVPPPINKPFKGFNNVFGVLETYYEIDQLPTIGNNTRVRQFFPDEINGGAIDTKMTTFDALQMVAKSNNYSIVPSGAKLTAKKDKSQTIRKALFNETNIIKDSLKISYFFEQDSETDSVKVSYRDAATFKEKHSLYPTNGLFPKSYELWGCTDVAKADSMAKYLYKQDRARRKTVEFKTDVQGLIPEFLDKIGVAHMLPKWGFASEVVSVLYVVGVFGLPNRYVITLADNIPIGYNTIIFRNDNGSVSDIITSYTSETDGNDKFTILEAQFPAWVHGYTDREATKCSLGTSTTVVKDYLVTSIKPNGNEVTITATNYDEDVYI